MTVASVRAAKVSDTIISGTKWRFELVDGAGQVLLQSGVFSGGARGPRRNSETEAELDHFGGLLRRQGWQVVRPAVEPNLWWAFEVARDDGVATYYAPQPRQKGMGCGAWGMWGLTMAIIIGLFLVCIVLAYTTEIRLTPVTN